MNMLYEQSESLGSVTDQIFVRINKEYFPITTLIM
jgi:hypothetical protein